ncbi:S-adenosyl-L-methionine-dependent methyltransferase [Apiospora rasikravindrae]|uniref:S-adenosyl-L-methionine-dependent methyltransferase n=1 Tax=Apiospora rasikravindrae TaxID=990691 RepID=A0ABR1RVS1_9PEZI
MAGQSLPNKLSISDAPRIASYSLQDPAHPEVEIAQAEHRIDLVNRWNIAPRQPRPRDRVRAGQRDGRAGRSGRGGRVRRRRRPSTPDYGAPFTLAQAQAHLSASPVGSRITWHRASPEDFLLQTAQQQQQQTWDVAVLAHCIWYFASPQVLASILGALRQQARVARVCVAEYALQATERAAAPHVLAALATGMLESHQAPGESEANIRSLLGPAAIAEAAREAGWTREGEEEETTAAGTGGGGIVVPRAGLSDGSWEVGTVVGKGFAGEIEEHIADERVRLVLRSAREATVAAVRGLGEGEKVRTMDVWVAAFV